MSETLAFDMDSAVCLFGLSYEAEASRRDKKGQPVYKDATAVLKALCGDHAANGGSATTERDPYETGEWEASRPSSDRRSRFANPLDNLEMFRQRGRGEPRPLTPDEAGT